MLPRDERQQKDLGLAAQWTKEDRVGAWQAAEYFLQQSDISASSTIRANRGNLLESFFSQSPSTQVHDKLCEALVKSRGVVVLFSHGDRQRLYLPDGGVLTSEEVSRLPLSRHKPLVLLFSCEGGKPGDRSEAGVSLAEALKKAGAKAVWAFEEKLDALEATRIASELFEHLKSGKPAMNAIEETVRKNQQKKGPTIRLKAQRETDGPRGYASGLNTPSVQNRRA